MDSYEGCPDPALQTFLMGQHILIPRGVRCFVPCLPPFFHVSGYTPYLN